MTVILPLNFDICTNLVCEKNVLKGCTYATAGHHSTLFENPGVQCLSSSKRNSIALLPYAYQQVPKSLKYEVYIRTYVQVYACLYIYYRVFATAHAHWCPVYVVSEADCHCSFSFLSFSQNNFATLHTFIAPFV